MTTIPTSSESKLNDAQKNLMPPEYIADFNQKLMIQSAQERINWAFTTFGQGLALSSSFGIQSAVMLHLATQVAPNIPVILIDTGYLFPETYRFIDELTARLKLNLHIYRSIISPAWQEARYGKLWEQGLDGLERYNQLNKVSPMNKALQELGVTAWLAGLRRQQSLSRENLPVLSLQKGYYKILPIIDWSTKQTHEYLVAHNLPYHPLWEQGYVSVGDIHTTAKWEPGMSEEQTRFFGLKRECGLHES